MNEETILLVIVCLVLRSLSVASMVDVIDVIAGFDDHWLNVGSFPATVDEA